MFSRMNIRVDEYMRAFGNVAHNLWMYRSLLDLEVGGRLVWRPVVVFRAIVFVLSGLLFLVVLLLDSALLLAMVLVAADASFPVVHELSGWC